MAAGDASLLAPQVVDCRVRRIGTPLPLLHMDRDHAESGPGEALGHRVVEEDAVRQGVDGESLPMVKPVDDLRNLGMHQRLAAAQGDRRQIALAAEEDKLLLKRIQTLAVQGCGGVVAVRAAAVAAAQDVQDRMGRGLSVPGQTHHVRSSRLTRPAPREKNASSQP